MAAPSPAQQRIRSTWQVRTAAGEPFAVVRVRNLQSTVHAAQDAWGRDGKPQPLLVSAEISLRDSFGDSSASDKVAGDTVHYGILSKAVLASLDRYQKPAGQSEGGNTLRGVLETIWSSLAGVAVNGTRPDSSARHDKVVLDISKIRTMAVTVTLPKASLLGSGVSLTALSFFDDDADSSEAGPIKSTMFGVSLRLHDLRIPTLIGVNSNERLAKQIVAFDVEIDKFDHAPDAYVALEALVVKTVEGTSFETLEALGAHLVDRITTAFRPQPEQTYSGPSGWQIKIRMEKPTAVPFAEAPCVEIRGGSK
ncbi:hypothetical protein MCOR25_001635 [Pyricularia grisea]|uniref:dihydroneopterin aldolase n=1 Tax=Pyricularia grisea TaxID=148305 RepID=A0A6P8BA72_PYRGI|nr:uncharacterized protein PgNI_03863 [Pyricularia grisea]KAI6380442.1 hypothetical protein MCOR25_001635 [Pyricularia grisea]TLD12713.1 hypothetical protein PgNI_03863 [Pyricularia grisea]